MNSLANKSAHRVVTALLLASFAGCLLCAPALALPVAQNHARGCHGHGPMKSGQSPANHQCCVSGHQAAVPMAAFSTDAAEISRNLPVIDFQVVATVTDFPAVAALPDRPPTVPLRV